MNKQDLSEIFHSTNINNSLVHIPYDRILHTDRMDQSQLFVSFAIFFFLHSLFALHEIAFYWFDRFSFGSFFFLLFCCSRQRNRTKNAPHRTMTNSIHFRWWLCANNKKLRLNGSGEENETRKTTTPRVKVNFVIFWNPFIVSLHKTVCLFGSRIGIDSKI